jgi:hypothetical protein
MHESYVLAIANPEKQCSLQAYNETNPMDGEQTWPSKDEIEEASKLFKYD